MALAQWDGHLTEGDMDSTPMAYYLCGGLRIALSQDNGWRAALEATGARQVTQAEYERADALEGGKE
jgi:hypothetical protein